MVSILFDSLDTRDVSAKTRRERTERIARTRDKSDPARGLVRLFGIFRFSEKGEPPVRSKKNSWKYFRSRNAA